MSEANENQEQFDCLTVLKKLRDEVSGRKPRATLHGPKARSSKWRRTWHTKVVNNLELALVRNQIPAEKAEKVEAFIKSRTGEPFGQKPLMEKKDILETNALISEVLGDK